MGIPTVLPPANTPLSGLTHNTSICSPVPLLYPRLFPTAPTHGSASPYRPPSVNPPLGRSLGLHIFAFPDTVETPTQDPTEPTRTPGRGDTWEQRKRRRLSHSPQLPPPSEGHRHGRVPTPAGAQRYPTAGRASTANGRGQGGDRGGPGGGERKVKPGRERGPPPQGPLGPEAAAAAAAVRETRRPRPHSPCRVPPASSALIGCAAQGARHPGTISALPIGCGGRKHLPLASGRAQKGREGGGATRGRHWLSNYAAWLLIGWRSGEGVCQWTVRLFLQP